jgi:hypothetical protein
MILSVVQLANPISHVHSPLDPSSDDLFADFISQNFLAQGRHDRLIDDRPMERQSISADWPISIESTDRSAYPRRRFSRQFSRLRAIGTAQKVVQTSSIHGLVRTNQSGQLWRIDGWQTINPGKASCHWPITDNWFVS